MEAVLRMLRKVAADRNEFEPGRGAFDRGLPETEFPEMGRRMRRDLAVPSQRGLFPQNVMVVLSESMGLVADVLQQPQGERLPP